MPETRFADVRRFESIDSTNRYLLDEARDGAPAGVVAVADHQSAGRGRLGRTWEAPPGANLLLSVLLRPDLDPSDRHLTTTAVALAAVDAIAEVTSIGGVGSSAGRSSPAQIGIKWPNDLVDADARKLAGVLAESDLAVGSAAAGMPPPVVVGIGINVNWPATDGDLPPELRGLAVSLQMLVGGPVVREALLGAVLRALEPRVADLETDAGRVRLADDLQRGCTTIGTRVRVDLADSSFEGTATGISPAGHLEVESDGIVRTVVAGDVVHVRPGG
jgi:BirA family transcriptional regulator, biotin operon repressor / biotin---[acetyl-CoA-carboxylase] ligase